MPATKNLCAQISLELHQKISEAREESGLTTAQYITQLLTEYYEMKENGGNRIEAVSPSIPGIEDGENLTHRKFRPALKTPNISAMLLSQLGLGFETRFESFF